MLGSSSSLLLLLLLLLELLREEADLADAEGVAAVQGKERHERLGVV